MADNTNRGGSTFSLRIALCERHDISFFVVTLLGHRWIHLLSKGKAHSEKDERFHVCWGGNTLVMIQTMNAPAS